LTAALRFAQDKPFGFASGQAKPKENGRRKKEYKNNDG